MASSSAMPSFEDMASTSGVHADVLCLFQARGVTTPGVMFHVFADRTKVESFLESLRAVIELEDSTRRRTWDERLVDHATVLQIAQHRSPPVQAGRGVAPTQVATTQANTKESTDLSHTGQISLPATRQQWSTIALDAFQVTCFLGGGRP